MTVNDPDDGVIFGEVARSPNDGEFRRFVNIAGSKAGFIDDGGRVYRQISAVSAGPRGLSPMRRIR